MATYNNSQQVHEKRKKQLSEVLAEIKTDRENNNHNINNSNPNNFANSFNSSYSNAGGNGNGLNNLGNTFGKKLAGLGNNGNSGFGAIGSVANDYITGSGSSGSAISDAINNMGSSSSSISSAINSNVNSGSVGSSGGGGIPWALIGGVAKKGYNSISGHDDQDYSDTEETIVYPLQGASVGASFGPWGALGGALYGLGYSFKDDLGLKDSNFLTQMLFPIGMGDGGGLRIGGKSILDLG